MNDAKLAEAQAFLAVLDHGGFGLAARHLGVTQSTVSRRVANLEARLDRRLLARTTRRLAATEAGELLADELRDVLGRLEQAEARVQALSQAPFGSVRLTMPSALGRERLAPALASLGQEHPGLDLELDFSDRYVDLVAERYDVAVRLSEPEQSGVAAVLATRSPVRLCAAPSYLRAHDIGDVATLCERHVLVQRTYAPRTALPARLAGAPITLRLRPRAIVSDVTAIRAMAIASGGVAMLPSYLADGALARGELAELPLDLTFAPLPVYVCMLEHRRRWTKVGVVVDRLLSVLREG